MALTLYQYGTGKTLGLPNPSPFCKTYLRLAGVPYTVHTLRGRPGSTTGKAPYIDLDGKIITDSSLIIEHLEGTGGHALDGRLTLAQRAESLAIQRMLDEHLYWVMLYGRWVDPEHKRKSDGYLKEVLGVPSFLLPPVAYLVRRRSRGALHGHGLGRHSRDTIYQFGITDVAALSHWLGSRPYGFGDTPTVVDACMAAYIGNIIRQWGNPLTAATAKYGNLIAHFERVMAQAFPELSAKAAA